MALPRSSGALQHPRGCSRSGAPAPCSPERERPRSPDRERPRSRRLRASVLQLAQILVLCATLLPTPAAAQLVESDCVALGTCRPVLFVQPVDCTARARHRGRRHLYRCEAEARLRLFLDDHGEVWGAQWLGDRPLDDTDPVPEEAVPLWRHCGDLPEIDPLPPHLAPYDDPDLGRCLAYYPEAVPLPPDVAKRARTKGLSTVHPFVRRAGEELVRRAWAEGIEIKVISGHRQYHPRGRRARMLASWHAFGLALDINMTWAKGLGEAARKRREDPEEHARWERLGEIGRELGLRWGGDMRSEDIFHYEWHPGYGGLIQPKELRAFLSFMGKGAKDYEASWRMLLPGAREIVDKQKVPAAKKGKIKKKSTKRKKKAAKKRTGKGKPKKAKKKPKAKPKKKRR